MTKKRTCFLCYDDAAKGSHYLTVKTPKKTIRFKFAVCESCGEALDIAATTFFTEFVAAYKDALTKEKAKHERRTL